jgi:hypothetical protein
LDALLRLPLLQILLIAVVVNNTPKRRLHLIVL